MPIRTIDIKELHAGSRRSKIPKSAEWQEITKVLEKPIPAGKAIELTLSEQTLQQFKNQAGAPLSFVQRLRKDYAGRFRIRLIDKTRIVIQNAEPEHKAGSTGAAVGTGAKR